MRVILAMVVSLVLLGGFVSADTAKEPLKVFILAGQSNMEGKAAVSTLDAWIDHPDTHEQLKHLKPGGKWIVRDDVWGTFLCREAFRGSEIPNYGPLTVGYGSFKSNKKDRSKPVLCIGPELGIGMVLGDHFEEPVLLIKAAWGGKSVKHNFRPPSAMPTEEEIKAKYQEIVAKHEDSVKRYKEQLVDKNRKKNPKVPGEIPSYEEYKESIGLFYRKLLEEVNKVTGDIGKYVAGYDPKQGYELAGLIWFQGWNDGVGSGNPNYVEQMAHFIRDIRRDLKSPKLPFVIGELGTDGVDAEGWVAAFRKQQADIAALPEFKGTVRLARTAQCWYGSPIDLSENWAEFRRQAQINENKPADDPTRVSPGEFFQKNWLEKYARELAYTSDKRYHYNGSGRSYYEMGVSMGEAMLELLK